MCDEQFLRGVVGWIVLDDADRSVECDLDLIGTGGLNRERQPRRKIFD